jgi:hypothetical protein
MSANPSLKAYMVHDGEPSEGCTLVFASSVNLAKTTALKVGWYDEYILMRAIRKPELDHCTEGKFDPWIAEDNDDLPKGVYFFRDDYYPDNTM